ncbi:MAG: Yip1 family protein [Gemmatimonadaceae bacterium]
MTNAAGSPVAGPLSSSMVERVKGILLQPAVEWPIIDGEQATVAGLYAGYIAPLSAIPPIASLIGMSVFGLRLPIVGTLRMPFGSLLTSTIVHYVLGLVSVYVLALIIDALAPTFGGQQNRIQALKVAAYASTATWIAGIVGLVPALGILGLLGLYSLYLIYLGLPVLMRSPRERAVGYSAAVVVSAIVLFMVVTYITGRVVSYPSVGLSVP